MKKITLVLSVLFFVFTLNGCGNDPDLNSEPELITYTGILQEQSSTDTEYSGTHLLFTESDDEIDEILALRSLTLNLSSGKYLENRVEIYGFLNTDDNVFEVSGISVIEILQEEEDIVSNENYKNSDFGIQIDYYTDWTMDDSNTEIAFFAPTLDDDSNEVDSIVISQEPFYYEPVLDEQGVEISSPLISYMEQNYPEQQNPELLINIIGKDEMESIKLPTDLNSVTYFLYRNGLIYSISFNASDNYLASNKKVFNEMLTTFRFIGYTVEDNLSDTETDNSEGINDSDLGLMDLPEIDQELTSFESLPYHFKASYPSNWYYAGERGSESGVLHHYSFSDESVTDENELLGLDVITKDLPTGNIQYISGKELIITESGNIYNIFVEIDGQKYQLSGDKKYKDLLTNMATSITPLENDAE